MRRLKEIALNAAIAAVTIAAVVMVGIRVNQAFFSSKKADSPAPRRIIEWRDFGNDGHRIGPPASSVTIVEFTDFQCPVCRRASDELRRIRQEFSNDVAVVIRHFPIPGHEFAAAAARAAECAGRQGAFGKYHDLLFASQDLIGKKSWTQFAEEAGLSDVAAFKTCLTDPAIAALVERDQTAGKKLGVTGTPTFLINDLKFPGYPGEGRLAELVRSALDAAPK